MNVFCSITNTTRMCLCSSSNFNLLLKWRNTTATATKNAVTFAIMLAIHSVCLVWDFSLLLSGHKQNDHRVIWFHTLLLWLCHFYNFAFIIFANDSVLNWNEIHWKWSRSSSKYHHICYYKPSQIQSADAKNSVLNKRFLCFEFQSIVHMFFFSPSIHFSPFLLLRSFWFVLVVVSFSRFNSNMRPVIIA